ncbi:MAG: hypothetical protein JOY81_03185 [Alphaproteobacteria bacterium]|nr:hypothetical protein [Alphaproteobacteria bacterium]
MASSRPRQFFLQAIDPDHGSPMFETRFVVEDLAELQRLLGDGAKDDPELEMYYTLEPDEVVAINNRFGTGFDPGDRKTMLERWSASRDLPYLIHGGYELWMMLDGRKPFTRITYEYPPKRHLGEDRFDHYVTEGLLYKEVDLEPFEEPMKLKNGRVFEGVRTAYYTLQGQEWRIEAWRLVEKAQSKGGWNETLEHLEGMLLGYEDWQNDWHLAKIRENGLRFGTALLWLAVTADELAAIEQAGYRALPQMQHTLDLVVKVHEKEADDREQDRLMGAPGVAALIRLRAKMRPFLELVDRKQSSQHRLPPERIAALNRCLVDSIEVVVRR